MEKMRATHHNSRTSAGGRVHSAKHNDRNFNVALAENINAELVHLDEFWHCYPGEQMTFEEAELRFYEEHFRQQLDTINSNYRANGHPENCKDMAAWKKCRRNAPEETTLQIGKMEEYVGADKLMECYRDYNQRLESWNNTHGNPFTLLTVALHVDEAVPHIQMRRVWHFTDTDGIQCVGQEKALEKAGIPLPNPDKKEGRYNNRKMTFDAFARNLWLDVIKEHGIDVERIALPDGKKKNRDKEDYIRDKYANILKEIEAAEKELSFQTMMANSESARALREHKRAEEAKEEARKMFSVVTELSELKTVAEYQRQVVDNDRALKKLAEGIRGGYAVAAANKLPLSAIRKVIDAIVNGFSDFVEALRINIAKVKVFEALRHLPNRHGVRQERTLDNILSDAYVDSEATIPGADGRRGGRGELVK